MNSNRPGQQLVTLAYRSRAVPQFDSSELDPLIATARSRNRAESITGLLIYDDGRFFQWLEGPPENISHIWQVIQKDPRHTDVEVLEHSASSTRMFGQWDLKLATKGTTLEVAANVPVVVSPELIQSLYRAPSSLPSPLTTPRAALVSAMKSSETVRADTLRQVVDAEIVPALVARYRGERAKLPLAHPRAAELARLLIASDPADAFTLLDLLQAEAGSVGLANATVSEPAARSLGELWASDDCTEIDVMLGLGRLQGAFHRLPLHPQALTQSGAPLRAVLVAPQPGEVHLLGAVLDAEILWRDGWEAQCEFPSTDAALNDMVADRWFDAVDLSLSTAFRREHWLPRMAKTIAAARRASMNPEIMVVVGGRVFYEHGATASLVGADVESATSMHVAQLINESLRQRSS